MTSVQPESQLMDSLEITSDPAAPAPVIPGGRPPRVWKFWGTLFWGLFVFAAMFVGQIAVVAYFVLRQQGPIDVAAALHVLGDGLTISISVITGLPAVLAALWVAIRLSRTPFADYLALRWTSWTNVVIGVVALLVVVMGWDLVSRLTGREVIPGFMGEVLELARAERRTMASGHRILRRCPDHGGVFRARFSLSRLVGNGARTCRRHPAVVAGMDLAASAIRLVLPRRGVLDRPVARLSPLSQQLDLADGGLARPQQSGRGGADHAA